MTLIELVAFIIMFSMGISAAKWLYPLGGLWAAVPGFIVGVVVIPAICLAHHKYRKRVYLGDKFMPECTCGSDDYRAEQVDIGFHTVCQKCGARYYKNGSEVFSISGEERTCYRKLVKYKGWI